MNHTGSFNNRLELQRSIMENSNLFKMICGAGNEDVDEVYKLSSAAARWSKSIDMSATIEVVESAVKEVNDAEKIIAQENILDNYIRPYLTVSIGMPGDHHVRKAKIISENCAECDAYSCLSN